MSLTVFSFDLTPYQNNGLIPEETLIVQDLYVLRFNDEQTPPAGPPLVSPPHQFMDFPDFLRSETQSLTLLNH